MEACPSCGSSDLIRGQVIGDRSPVGLLLDDSAEPAADRGRPREESTARRRLVYRCRRCGSLTFAVPPGPE